MVRSSEIRNTISSVKTEMSESYHSKGIGESPLSRALAMRSADMTGLRPDMVVDMMTSSMPYDVTELDPNGTHSAAPKAMTNTANTICGAEHVMLTTTRIAAPGQQHGRMGERIETR